MINAINPALAAKTHRAHANPARFGATTMAHNVVNHNGTGDAFHSAQASGRYGVRGGRTLALTVLAVLLAACGGGPPSPRDINAPDPSAVARSTTVPAPTADPAAPTAAADGQTLAGDEVIAQLPKSAVELYEFAQANMNVELSEDEVKRLHIPADQEIDLGNPPEGPWLITIHPTPTEAVATQGHTTNGHITITASGHTLGNYFGMPVSENADVNDGNYVPHSGGDNGFNIGVNVVGSTEEGFKALVKRLAELSEKLGITPDRIYQFHQRPNGQGAPPYLAPGTETSEESLHKLRAAVAKEMGLDWGQ